MMEEFPFEYQRKVKKREIALWILETIQIVAITLMFYDKLWILLPFLIQTIIIVVQFKMLIQTERAYMTTLQFITKDANENLHNKA